MKIVKISSENLREVIKKAIKAIKKGNVLICPTDTVYGLVCDATDKKAVGKLFRIKKRQKTKPIPIFVKNIKMAKRLAFIDKKQEEFLKKVWPGKVTVVLKRKKGIKIYGVDKNTIALRIPDYKLITDLFKTQHQSKARCWTSPVPKRSFWYGEFNKPLAGTSANISGKPASIKIKEILKQFENQKIQADLVVDAGNLRESQSSTVIDLTNKKAEILRKGEITIK